MKPTQKQKEEAATYIANLDSTLTDKCSLCNATLTHTIMKGHVETGAPISTIIGELVEKYNEGKPAGDQVSADALRGRVDRQIHPSRKEVQVKAHTRSLPRRTEEDMDILTDIMEGIDIEDQETMKEDIIERAAQLLANKLYARITGQEVE